MATVQLTMLQVSDGAGDARRTVAVARLSRGKQSRAEVRPGGQGNAGRLGLLAAGALALAALRQPCVVHITCNDKVALDLMRRPRSGGVYGEVCGDFALAAAPHELHLDYARGNDMGHLGRAAYQVGQRRLAAATAA